MHKCTFTMSVRRTKLLAGGKVYIMGKLVPQRDQSSYSSGKVQKKHLEITIRIENYFCNEHMCGKSSHITRGACCAWRRPGALAGVRGMRASPPLPPQGPQGAKATPTPCGPARRYRTQGRPRPQPPRQARATPGPGPLNQRPTTSKEPSRGGVGSCLPVDQSHHSRYTF